MSGTRRRISSRSEACGCDIALPCAARLARHSAPMPDIRRAPRGQGAARPSVRAVRARSQWTLRIAVASKVPHQAAAVFPRDACDRWPRLRLVQHALRRYFPRCMPIVTTSEGTRQTAATVLGSRRISQLHRCEGSRTLNPILRCGAGAVGIRARVEPQHALYETALLPHGFRTRTKSYSSSRSHVPSGRCSSLIRLNESLLCFTYEVRKR